MNRTYTKAALLAGLGVVAMNSHAAETIHASVDINASVEDVWHAWTTNDGARSFFARASNIDARLNGDYEIFFFPDNEPGTRGAEDTTTLIVEPNKRFVFTWSAPTKWPAIRAQRTVVEISMDSVSSGKTRVTLRHSLWGDSKEWIEVREYFAGAWPVILKRLQYSFDHGPIDWDNPPPNLMYSGPSN